MAATARDRREAAMMNRPLARLEAGFFQRPDRVPPAASCLARALTPQSRLFGAGFAIIVPRPTENPPPTAATK
jgi:hypothetical protein